MYLLLLIDCVLDETGLQAVFIDFGKSVDSCCTNRSYDKMTLKDSARANSNSIITNILYDVFNELIN